MSKDQKPDHVRYNHKQQQVAQMLTSFLAARVPHTETTAMVALRSCVTFAGGHFFAAPTPKEATRETNCERAIKSGTGPVSLSILRTGTVIHVAGKYKTPSIGTRLSVKTIKHCRTLLPHRFFFFSIVRHPDGVEIKKTFCAASAGD